jgi:iron complex outermembrane recepter protein
MLFHFKFSSSLLLFILLAGISVKGQNQLSGRILDADKNTPLTGAVIYITDLKTGAASNDEGAYTITNIPAGNYVVEISLFGYGVQTSEIEIKGQITQDFRLSASEFEGQEVIITGNSSAKNDENSTVPVVEVPNSYLLQNTSTNIIDALSKLPGVSGITDGQSIAKPVIRGLGYNRVVTISDGVRQEGQQWGDEFGIEVDQNAVDRVEILKGPASLSYGSDAISGVVNLIPAKNMPEGEISGDILNNYQTNNGLIGNSLHIAGTNNGISWSGRISNTMAHAYQNKYDGYVYNSQFNNFCYDAGIGIHRSWGYSQLHFSYFELRTGIVEGNRDSATGKFVGDALPADGSGPVEIIATKQMLRSYTPFLINQLVKHSKISWDNSFSVGEGRINAILAWQRNRREEHNDPAVPDVANIYYYLNTINYDVRYISPEKNMFNYSVGVNGMYQDSKNLGTLLLIPEYNLFDLGAFAIANKKIGKLSLSAGLRYDNRQFSGHDAWIDSISEPVPANSPGALHPFSAYSSNFSGFSGSIGANYQFTGNIYLKLNAARGFRAPNVAETGSNGIHDGTVVWEIGDHNLLPESSLQFDIAPGIKSKDVTAEIDLFSNSISNYIYPNQLKSSAGGDSLTFATGFGNAPTFKYTQANATLTGGEAVLDIHPSALPWLDFYAAYSTVNAQLSNKPDSEKYLPFIPPARLRSEITINFKKLNKTLVNSYVRIGIFHSFSQEHVYHQTQVYYALPSAEAQASLNPSAAYTLFNAGVGTDIMSSGKKICSVYISIDNITDLGYVDYMSRFKYYPVNFASNPYRVGVYNMGRNVSFKLLIPVRIKS